MFDIERMREDMALKGWQPTDLAQRANVSKSTVSRFLSGESQTARVNKKLAEAMGYSARRYVLTRELRASA